MKQNKIVMNVKISAMEKVRNKLKKRQNCCNLRLVSSEAKAWFILNKTTSKIWSNFDKTHYIWFTNKHLKTNTEVNIADDASNQNRFTVHIMVYGGKGLHLPLQNSSLKWRQLS